MNEPTLESRQPERGAAGHKVELRLLRAVRDVASGLFNVPAASVRVSIHDTAAPPPVDASDAGKRLAQVCQEAMATGRIVEMRRQPSEETAAQNPQPPTSPDILLGIPLFIDAQEATGAVAVVAPAPMPDIHQQLEALGSLAQFAATAQGIASELDTRQQRIEQLERRLQAHQESNRERRQVAADVVHDMRNAINAIGFVLKGIKIRSTGALEQTMVETALRALRGLTALVDDLLMIATMQHGEYQVRYETFPLRAELLASIEVFGASASDRIFTHCEPSLMIETDRRLLHRVVGNLVANAVRHAGDSGPISVEAQRTEEAWRICIRDSGPGIAPQERESVFERTPRVRHRKGQGLGFGLPFARRAARWLGGDLRYVALPAGACFEFSLPLRPRQPCAAAVAREAKKNPG
ncbi:MAG: hypothetical protein RIT45_634 [Pseudomonadota bacterium]